VLDVVIPHLNSPYIHKCVDSLRQYTPTGVLSSVVVLDQGDKQIETKADFHVRCATQIGFARAANLGMSMGRAPYVMVLNDDCEFLDCRWWYGILKTFSQHRNLLCVNPSSPRNPGEDSKYLSPSLITKDVYSTLLAGRLLDGICMWAPVFDRSKLSGVQGCKPGLWFDELYWPGGGEDYDLGRRASLSGMRCVGTEWSWVWHWWHQTTMGGKQAAKHDGGTYDCKWGTPTEHSPDLFGHTGSKVVVDNKTLEGK